jgi:tetratricopeptide (TPR) repeat protein
MLLRLFLLVWLLQSVAAESRAQSTSRFTLKRAYELIDQGNPVLIEGYLKAWSAVSPREIDLFVAKFNVDFQRSADTGSDSLFAQALGHLNTAAGIQPRRLDLWLKTIYALNQREFYADQADMMILLMDRSDQFNHDWLWEGDAPLQESKTVFLMTMHDHLEQWVGRPAPPVAHIRRVATRLSESFPSDASAVAAIGLSHLLEGNPALGVPYLKRATELEPRNGSLWLMLAEAYEATADLPAAISAYDRVIELGNEEQKSVAAAKLERLR